MDVNGTKFHLLLTRDDWGRAVLENGETLGAAWEREGKGETVSEQKFSWDENAGAITLQKQIFRFKASEKDRKPSPENRRGAARDRYGNWYWIDENGAQIKVFSTGSQTVSRFYPPGSGKTEEIAPGAFQSLGKSASAPAMLLRGLAVTIDHFLVVGTLEPAGLLVFDLFAGGEPSRILWKQEIPFAPYDIAARHCGGVFVLDRDQKRCWTLDRSFNVIGEASAERDTTRGDFEPVVKASKDAERFEESSAPEYPADFSALNDPIAVEALPDDTVLILDQPPETQDFSIIYRYYRGMLLDKLETRGILALVDEDGTGVAASPPQPRFRLRGFDFAFLQAGEAGDEDRLFIVSEEGNQAFSFRLICQSDSLIETAPPLPNTVVAKNFELAPVAEYYPLRLFGGKGFAAAGDKIYYDFGDRWLPVTKQNRPRFETSGTLVTQIFDGKEPNCVWHRLMLDGCIPPETTVEIFSRAAEIASALAETEWSREPRLYLRGNGSDLPFTGGGTVREKGVGTWELLFQRASHRFLQLKLVFSGNAQRTPRVSALRVYYPRFSYLDNYLPAIYREDEQSAFFLDRFLANFEGLYTGVEERIAAVQMLFDVRSAPAETLEWLADWLGVALDPAWEEDKRRLFISHAVDFFQYRGTLRGLRLALRLALDKCADESIFEPQSAQQKLRDPIRIVERFQTRRTPALIPADATGAQNLPRVVVETKKWKPAQGADVLNRRYGEKFAERSLVTFPLVRPADEKKAALWDELAAEAFGFIPSTAAADERQKWQNFLRDEYSNNLMQLEKAHKIKYQNWNEILLPRGTEKIAQTLDDWRSFVAATSSPIRRLWQDFLARRYHRIAQLNAVFGTHWSSFAELSLFDQMPRREKPSADWLQFEGAVLPMHQTAHRFTVLIPALIGDGKTESLAEQNRRLELVRRVVALEKPAHTVFDFRFYWNLFRLDEVRLGLDTLVGLGSRDALLNPELILGQSFTGESSLGAEQPEKYTERYALGNQCLENNEQ